MSWSYSGDPASSPLDQVRFWLQDIDVSNQLMQNEELTWLFDTHGKDMHGGEIWAAAIAAEVLANRFAREVSISADGVSVQLSELQDRYEKLAVNLRDAWHQFGSAATGDFASVLVDDGIDPSIKPLMFGIGFHDNYEAGQQDYGGYAPGRFPWSADVGVPMLMDETAPPQDGAQ